jgi:hypothetical protein
MDLIDLHERFNEDLLGEDDLGTVIRGHIHFEASILLYLKEVINAPKHLDNLSFSQRVNLATELGVISKDHKKPLLEMARIRNVFAHNLDAQLTENMCSDLYNSFTLNDKPAIDKALATLEEMVSETRGFKTLSIQQRFFMLIVCLKSCIHYFHRDVFKPSQSKAT